MLPDDVASSKGAGLARLIITCYVVDDNIEKAAELANFFAKTRVRGVMSEACAKSCLSKGQVRPRALTFWGWFVFT
jgi:hypothetical protein